MQRGELARPDLPRPTCRVRLVCGPPAAGKSTFVEAHADPGDIVIDLDDIAQELGFGRDRPASVTSMVLEKRNARLTALAAEPADRVAWVILAAPARCLRQWWCDVLGVHPVDLTVLIPPREELFRRVMRDPERRQIGALQMRWIDQWLQRERTDDPGILKSGCGVNGFPSDPLHPWNHVRP